MTTKSEPVCIESDSRSVGMAGSGVHHPAQGCQQRLHAGVTDWRLGILVDHASGSSTSIFTTPEPAPDRVAVPVARHEWTPREIAAYLIGASRRGDGVFGHLSLLQFDDGYVLYDLVDGSRVTCPRPSDVVRAVETCVR